MPRDNIVLQCIDCKSRNYTTTKNKKTTTERLEFSKFCRRCRKHTSHKESEHVLPVRLIQKDYVASGRNFRCAAHDTGQDIYLLRTAGQFSQKLCAGDCMQLRVEL